MAINETSGSHNKRNWKTMRYGTGPGAVYGLGFIGAAVYFIQHAETFWMGALGVLKAIFWPAFVIYKLLELLKM